jgi:hypothetical protein
MPAGVVEEVGLEAVLLDGALAGDEEVVLAGVVDGALAGESAGLVTTAGVVVELVGARAGAEAGVPVVLAPAALVGALAGATAGVPLVPGVATPAPDTEGAVAGAVAGGPDVGVVGSTTGGLLAGAWAGTFTRVGVVMVCTTGAVATAPEEVTTGAGATTWRVIGSTTLWVAGPGAGAGAPTMGCTKPVPIRAMRRTAMVDLLIFGRSRVRF